MALSEHKNLQDANRHNPKGFETAQNNTILTKGNGTPGLDDGSLEWTLKSNIKAETYNFSGYCSLIENYQYAEPLIYGQSPYELNQDYGSATISSGTTVMQKRFFRIGCFVNQAALVKTAQIQISNSNAENFTVALVYYSPSDTATTAYPVVLVEKVCTGLSSDNKVVTYALASTDFTTTDIPSGAHLFIMVKGITGTAGSTAYVNAALRVGYEK